MMFNKKTKPRRARRVSVAYAIITALWIVLSDRLLNLLVPESEQQVLLQTIKGLLFIVLTAVLIYFLLRRELEAQALVLEALRKSEAQWRSLMENAPDTILTVDQQGTILFINDVPPGSSEQAIVGTSMLDYVSKEHHTTVREAIDRVFETGEPTSYEIVARGPHDTLVWYSTRLAPVKHNDHIRAVILITHDISDRKQTEQALQKSEEKYRQIVETAHEGIWVVDTETITTFVNARMVDMLGYAADEMLGRSLFDFLDADNRALAEAQIERRRQGHRGQYDLVFQRKDGSPLVVLISANPLWDQQGHYHGSQAMITDITELSRAQDAEHKQRVLAEALAQTARALISALDLDTVMHTILENIEPVVPHDAANIMLIEGEQAYAAYWRGYSPEHSRLLSQFRIRVAETPNLQHMLSTGSGFLVPHTEHYAGWVQEPVTKWVKSYVAAPIRSHGNVIGFLNVDSGTPGHFNDDHAQRLQIFADQASLAIEHAQLYEQIQQHADILEQRIDERTAELNHAKERTEAILNSSNDIIILCRKDGTINQVNQAFMEAFELGPDDALNELLTHIVTPDHADELDRSFERIVQTLSPERLEVVAQYKDSVPFNADVALSPVIGPDNALNGVVCSLRDITQHKQMEAQLRQMLEHEMELSELKSRYVAMAAHDLRNPLAVIKSAVDIIEDYRHQLSEERLQNKLETIQIHIQTMVAMLDDILMLERAEAGKLTFEPGALDIVTFCQRMGREMELGIGASSRIVFSSQGACHSIMADQKLLRHILSNLLSNALKYSPGESNVNFTLDCQPEQIILEVEDQGIGIPAADQERLFQAFHRASNTRNIPGTGLGLSIVKQAVELHGGTITFDSEVDKGTTFTVTLPTAATQKPVE